MKYCFGILLVWLLAAPTFAAPPSPTTKVPRPITVSPQDLRELGIRSHALRLSNVSEDGHVTVLIEKERDARLKAQGRVWMLRVFRFEAGSRRPHLSTILLPTTDLQMVWISPDGNRGLAVSDEGTRLIGIDLKAGTAHIVFKHTKGEPSFRVMPALVWFEKGRFHTVGYFMGPDERMLAESVVAVDDQGRGYFAIHPVRNITGLLRLRSFRECLWHATDQVYFTGQTHAGPFILGAWYGTKDLKVTAVEKADAYGALAAADNRVTYPARNGTKHAFVVADLAINKKWQLGDGSTDYEYPYMSADGKTVLASTFDLRRGRMSTFYATEDGNFVLHPVPGMHDLPIGTIRFAGNGRIIVLYNQDGLQWFHLPLKVSAPPARRPAR